MHCIGFQISLCLSIILATSIYISSSILKEWRWLPWTIHDKFFFTYSFFRPNEAASDPSVRRLVVEQTKQWSEMVEKQRKHEWELMKNHLHAQEEILRKLMETSQLNQMKQLEAKHERWEWRVVLTWMSNYDKFVGKVKSKA